MRSFSFIILTIALLIVLYPLYFIVVASFSAPEAVRQGKTFLFPVGFTLAGYEKILNHESIWIGYRNTITYTVLGTFINVALTLPAAYALSRKDLLGRNAIMIMITFTMFFNGGLIPTYLVVHKLGMINTIWAMVIPNAIAAWNIIVSRTFFSSSIPNELLEAAKIDGCSDARFFFSIVLPLSTALTAIMVLFLWSRTLELLF